MKPVGRSISVFYCLIVITGCGDHTPSAFTRPPVIPKGYEVFYTNVQPACIHWLAKPRGKKPDGTLDLNQVVISNVERVGVKNNIIFGTQLNPGTTTITGFSIDTNTNVLSEYASVSKLNDELKRLYGIESAPTVPARFYASNSDGGSR